MLSVSPVREAPADHSAHRRIFVETFANEPSFQFMLPDPQTRPAHVAWLVGMKLKVLAGRYTAFSAGASDPLGFSWWLAPGTVAPGTWELMRQGYWQGPFRFGRHFSKMLAFGAQEGRLLAPYRQTHWLLDVIAADPKAQRSGVGGALMQPIFERAQSEGRPCFVLTHNPRNVRFYEKYGFRLVIDEPVLGPESPHAYGLERPSR